MSDFHHEEFEHVTSAHLADISIPDRLAMIDDAYHADDRSACIKMIDDLYAMFDRAV